MGRGLCSTGVEGEGVGLVVGRVRGRWLSNREGEGDG